MKTVTRSRSLAVVTLAYVIAVAVAVGWLYPNYFGEFGFWVAMALFGVAAAPGQAWWLFAGAAAMLVRGGDPEETDRGSWTMQGDRIELVGAGEDGLKAISDALAAGGKVDSIQILSHGAACSAGRSISPSSTGCPGSFPGHRSGRCGDG